MALKTQTVSIPLGVGIDTKTDPKLVSTSKLGGLTNARVGDLNIKKRFGYNELSNTVLSSGVESSLSQGDALGGFNNEMLMFDRSNAYSYSETQNLFVDKGVVLGVDVERFNVSATDADLLCGDHAYLEGIYCFAYYDDTNSELKCKVIDRENGSVILGETLVEAVSSKSVRVVATAGAFYIIYFDETNTRFRSIALSNLQTLNTAVNISGYGSERFDAVVISSGRIGVIISDDSSSDVKLGIYDVAGASLASVTIAEDANRAVAILYDPDAAQIWAFISGDVVYSSSSRGVAYLIYDTSLNPVLTATNVSRSFNFQYTRIAPVLTSTGNVTVYLEEDYSVGRSSASGVSIANDTMSFGADFALFTGQPAVLTGDDTAPTGLSFSTTYYLILSSSFPSSVQFATTLANALSGTQIDITGDGVGAFILTSQTSINTNKIKKDSLTSGGTATDLGTAVYGYHLASRPILQEENIYFLVDFETALQATSFLLVDNIASTANISAVSKCNYDIGKGNLSSTVLPQAVRVSDTIFSVSNSYKVSLESVEEGFLFQEASDYHEFDFSLASRYFNKQIAQNTIIAGGLVKSYDGSVITELNFNQYPEDLLSAFITSGGSLAAGTYGLVALYEWTDSQGQVHRSAPSFSVSETTTGATSSIYVSVPCIELTEKTGAVGEVKLVVYMTQVNGSIYYRKATDENVKSQKYVDFAAITEAPAGTEEILYTTGGVLENTAPPPSRIVAVSKNRVFLVNSENKREYWFSKLTGRNEGVSFNSILAKRVQQTVDAIDVIETMDDKIVFWKKGEIYFSSGDGPNNLGINDTFTEAQLVTNQVGSDNPDSAVLMADGLMFQSTPKGIWLLDRALNLQYIGADVETYNDLRVVSANMLQDVNEVRFATGDGTQLVYDHYKKQWAVDDNIQANDAIYINGKYNYLRSANGIVFRESEGYLDNSKSVRISLETPWIKVANVQGFQRVKRAAILGKFLSSHSLKIEIAYDYEEFYREHLLWTAGTVLDISEFGDDILFGDDSVFGGVSDGVYQVRVHMPRQKCQAVKFRISDVSSSDAGASMELTALDLEIGVKKGLNKLRADKSI